MVLVSVILPTYNSEKTVERALNSVASQAGKGRLFDLEIIVVDDCSDDNTTAIVKGFPIIFLENDKNSGGPNKGRNKGLEVASGDWIAFIDHDDEWKENKIQAQLENTTNPVISCGYSLFIENTFASNVVTANKSNIKVYQTSKTLKQLLSRDVNVQNTYFGSLIIHKSLKHIRFEEEFGQVDYDYIIKLLEGNASTEVCMPLFNRFVETANLSLNEGYRTNNYLISKRVLTEFQSQYPKETARGLQRLNAAMGRYYYQVGQMKMARTYFKKAKIGLLNIFFIGTSYFGSFIVKKFYRIFN